MWRKVDRYFAHGCHGIDNMTPFISLEMVTQGTSEKHKSENA